MIFEYSLRIKFSSTFLSKDQSSVMCFVFVAVPCLKMALSKTLGYGIVVGSAMSKFAFLTSVRSRQSICHFRK